jgi:hypothetical protein
VLLFILGLKRYLDLIKLTKTIMWCLILILTKKIIPR